MPKYRALRERLLAEGVVSVAPSQEAPLEWLGAAHDPEYVERCLRGTLSAGEVRRLGLPWSPALVRPPSPCSLGEWHAQDDRTAGTPSGTAIAVASGQAGRQARPGGG